jgi:hypothetical protein
LGQAKAKLQLLSWKVQYAAAWALENNVIIWAVAAVMITVFVVSFAFWLASFSTAITTSALYLTLHSTWIKVYVYGAITIAASLATSLVLTGVGLALKTSIFPTSIQEKGAWIQSVSWKSFLLTFLFLVNVIPSNNQSSNQTNANLDNLWKTSKELQELLLQSMNQANNQIAFVDAQLPELIDKWLVLTSP